MNVEDRASCETLAEEPHVKTLEMRHEGAARNANLSPEADGRDSSFSNERVGGVPPPP